MKKIFDIQNLSQKLSNIFQFDVRALALFRIVFGFGMLLDLCIRLSDFKAFYTQDGVLPYNYLIQFFDKYLYVPIYQLNDNAWFVSICFAIHLGAVFCFTIGYKTKLFQVISLQMNMNVNCKQHAMECFHNFHLTQLRIHQHIYFLAIILIFLSLYLDFHNVNHFSNKFSI